MLKNLRNILPLPRGWKDDELRFGTRLNDAVTELLKNVRRLMALIAPESKQVVSTDMLLTDAQKRAAVENLGAAKWLWLSSDDDDWSKIWAKLSWLNPGDVLPIWVSGPIMQVLTNGEITTGHNGTVGYSGSNYYFSLVSATSNIRHITMRLVATEAGVTSVLIQHTTSRIETLETDLDTLEANALVKTAQTLTSAEQTQVRTNLGLGTASTRAVANNLTTTASGSVLDARQGKALKDSIDSVSDELRYTMYSSVTDLGLTSGSATIDAIYAAMDYPSIGFFGAQQLASGEAPTNSGYIRIEKVTSARARIFYYHKSDAARDAQMVLTSSNTPSGTWE